MNEICQVNQDQAALWNDVSGRTWVEMQPMLDRVLQPFETLLVEEGFVGASARVLDIGCGAGATTLAMARRLGPEGSCLGADISEPLVAAARSRANAEGIARVSFIRADAQTYSFDPGSFDAVISRFGVMFFDDAKAAFTNIRAASRPDAKLTFIAWRSPSENDFLMAARRAAAPYLPNLPKPDPNAPGQFAFADGERVRQILTASGWSKADLRPLDIRCSIAEADLLAYVTKLGPVGAALRDANETTRARVVEALRGEFARFVRDGAAHIGMAVWLASAQA